MANNCLDTNLLTYGGTSQVQRILNALLSKYAQVDERTTADLVLLTKRYSAYLNYYDLTNVITGDWQNIMSKDVAVNIASVADWRIKNYTPFVEYIYGKIKDSATDTDATNYFKIIFDFIFSLAADLDRTYQELPSDVSYTEFLAVSIASKSAVPLNILGQYYQAFKASLLIDEGSTFTDPLTPVDNLIFSQNFHSSGLSSPWQIPAVTAPLITLTGVIRDDINLIITHNLFTGTLQSFLDAIVNIVSRTPDYLEETLENYPSHEPHYALYLAFLRLFRFAQDHLNQYTQHHLDFYYKDVLQLSNNAAEPDFVHLVFELQKNIDQHLLSKGTAFKAGKDAGNNDLFYSLTDDLVIQKAIVQSLQSLYLNKDINPVTLFASSTADSEDGQGAKLLSADNSWFPFGNPKKISQANIGFAIGSNILYLNEGKRTVTLTFQCDSLGSITDLDLSEIFTVQFTGKKNWYTALGYTPFIVDANSFSLSVTIYGDAPPIVPYSQKIHGGNFTQELPMVQLLLANYTSYQKIKLLTIKSISLQVTATVKNLSLQNDDGKIDPSKPFKPFGEFPGSEASFIIGSKEIFQKSLSDVAISIEWQQPPLASDTANTYLLKQGDWIQFGDSLNLNDIPITITNANAIPQSAPQFIPNDDYAITSVDGFIKLELGNDDHSIATYLSGVKTKLSQTGASVTDDGKGNLTFTLNAPALQDPPTPPVAKSISITYSTQIEEISFAETDDKSFAAHTKFYYHIEPFGFREMHPFITDDPLNFLPVFNLDDSIAKDDGGELWIGLSNALPGETFSILFQVSDGSANPLKIMTDVDWYYLSNNNWLKFDHLSVTDQTNKLTRSGLVILNVPEAATTTNSRAGNGLLWIKAAIDHDPDAVCKLIAVRANAAKAQFDGGAKQIEFTKSLPPATISKPAVADAALKKTEQPYPSFDGRVHETDDQFYLRVSERLRHKHRAITTWDYERLTLQYYPQIHKAKCINHTGFVINKKTNDQKYSEVLPGHVMVVTIPDLTSLNTANLLRPYTSIGLLTEIQQYLQTLTSPFVRLHVCNPQFEEIQFDFQVTFHQNYDPVFFTDLLNTEIEQFLTPWAFGNAKDIEFGSTVEKSVVLNFIEERYYVDFVTCFNMNQIILRDGSVIQDALYNIEEAVASTARSVLVSYYNEETKVKHIINSPANCACDG